MIGCKPINIENSESIVSKNKIYFSSYIYIKNFNTET